MPRMKGGKVSKGMKKFPRISDYLEVHHPDVYQLLVDSGMIGNLTPKRGVGRTFLVPDSKLVKEIRKLLDSVDDGPEKASEIIGSLIIKDYLPSPKEWKEHQDDIPNVMGKKVQIKSVNGSKVELVAGTIEPDKKYVPFERQGNAPRGNTAVWKLSGHVPHDAKVPDATGKYTRPGAPKSGSFEFSKDENINLMELTRRIISDLESGKEQPFEEALAGLLDTCVGDQLCKTWICMNLAHGPAAAYFQVFQPGCDASHRLLNEQVGEFLNSSFRSTSPNPSRVLLDSWSNIKVSKDVVQERFAELDSALESGNAVAALEEAYKTLAEENRIGNTRDVLPEVLVSRLRQMSADDGINIAKFLAGNDELGFRIFSIMNGAENKAEAVREALELCGNRSYITPTLSSTEFMSKLIKPTQLYLSGTLAFARSSHCLNVPMDSSTVVGMGEYDASAENPYSGEDLNRATSVVEGMESAASRSGGNISMPEGLIACIKNYAKDIGLSGETSLKDLIGDF